MVLLPVPPVQSLKIKFYMGVKGKSLEDAKKQLEQLTEDVKAEL